MELHQRADNEVIHNKSSLLDSIKISNLLAVAVFMAIVVISYIIAHGQLALGLAVALVPVVIIVLIAIIANPYNGFIILFIVNYFVIAIFRYSNIGGISVIIDIIIAITFASVILKSIIIEPSSQKIKLVNGITIMAFIWLCYCACELMNPTALVDEWIFARGLVYYFLLMTLLTFCVFNKYRYVNIIIMILSVLTLIGFIKAMMQKHIGFDAAESALLSAGMYRTHLLTSGTRYFSIYASAGIFGAVMGHAFVFFAIISIYTINNYKRAYFIFIALISLYGLFLSGTRGALAVPAAGFFLFILLSKQYKIIIPTFIFFIATYIILAMTTIGQNNALIRRMRTAFNPDDPSLLVRLNNQKLLGAYLVDKPFGEGLGLSGVDSKLAYTRFTTSIPTDSWYVKIWVETGIVGLILHITILVYIILHGSYIIFFKIKNNQLKGTLTAFQCGIFGIIVSSYGNQVLGQFPVVLITYMGAALVFMGPHFDKQLEITSLETNP